MEYCDSPMVREPLFFAVFDLETFALLKIFGMKFINMVPLPINYPIICIIDGTAFSALKT
jgi:hypothetical protein